MARISASPPAWPVRGVNRQGASHIVVQSRLVLCGCLVVRPLWLRAPHRWPSVFPGDLSDAVVLVREHQAPCLLGIRLTCWQDVLLFALILKLPGRRMCDRCPGFDLRQVSPVVAGELGNCALIVGERKFQPEPEAVRRLTGANYYRRVPV